jgi:hypothetical protein
MEWLTVVVIDWYGVDAGWFYPLEHLARRRYRRKLTVEHQSTSLIYHLRELDVPGDGIHDVRIAFYLNPPYNTMPCACGFLTILRPANGNLAKVS